MDPVGVAKHVLEPRRGTDFGQYEEDQDHHAERLISCTLTSMVYPILSIRLIHPTLITSSIQPNK
jgi:hypothetical protein